MAHGEEISEAAALEALMRDAKRNDSRSAPTSRPPHKTNKRFLDNLLQDHRSYNARTSFPKPGTPAPPMPDMKSLADALEEQRKSRLRSDKERERRSHSATTAFGEAVAQSAKGPSRGRSSSPGHRQKRKSSHRERSESPVHGHEHRSTRHEHRSTRHEHRSTRHEHRSTRHERHSTRERERDGPKVVERKDSYGDGDASNSKQAFNTKQTSYIKKHSGIKKSSDAKKSSDTKTSHNQHKPKHLEEREESSHTKKSRRHKTRETRSPAPEPVKDRTPKDDTTKDSNPRDGTPRDDKPVLEVPGIRWNSKGEGREWDRGKVMRLDADDDGGYDVVQRPAWGKS